MGGDPGAAKIARDRTRTEQQIEGAIFISAEEFNPRKHCVRANDAEKQASKVMEELKKCGILCVECHRSYDAHVRYGHPKVSWDQQFKDKGPGNPQLMGWAEC